MTKIFSMLLLCATILLMSCEEKDDSTQVMALGVTLNKTALSLMEGAKETLIATVAPDNVVNKSVRWTSSVDSVATVSPTGEVTAVKAGTAIITATSVADNTKKATCTITVAKRTISVSGVTLNKTALSLTEGAKETLVATVSPDNADDKSVTWTFSVDSVATVSPAGEVTAVKAGTTIIIATSVADSTKKATCIITVTKGTASESGVTLNKTALSLTEGAKEILVATVVSDNADDKSVAWTSNTPAVATVSPTGEVTAVKAGTTIIIATSVADSTKKATCTITVTKGTISVSGVTLNKTAFSLTEGAKETLIATVTPYNADDKSVAWTSNAPAVATVSPTGEVTAVKAGTAIITATSVADNTKKATCTITVTKGTISVSGVTLNKTVFSLTEGAKETLIATVTPYNADDKSVTWTSNAPAVATVSPTGEVTAIKAGTAIITATSVTDNSKKATCTITVTKGTISVSGVTLNKTAFSLREGAKETLIATVTPYNADDKSVTWTSNAPAVATVSPTGEVTAVKAGTVTITATSVADNTKKATCAVTVTTDITTTVAVGDYYYSDKTYSSSLDKTKNCVGIVFWVDPANARKGKIVSLDESMKLIWSNAQTWTSSRKLPDGMTWIFPSKDELQYLFCTYTNIDYITWNSDFCPSPETPGGREAFDAKLIAAGGNKITQNSHWSSTIMLGLLDEYPWTVSFLGSYTDFYVKSSAHYVRVIAAF